MSGLPDARPFDALPDSVLREVLRRVPEDSREDLGHDEDDSEWESDEGEFSISCR